MVNNAAMNIVVHVPFLFGIFCGHRPRSGIESLIEVQNVLGPRRVFLEKKGDLHRALTDMLLVYLKNID